MTAATSAYPQPYADADNRPLIEGWRAGQLVLQVCGGCGRTVFYPRPACPYCWSAELSWKAASGRGSIVSFSLVNRPNDPAFFPEVPIILAEIRIEEEVAQLPESERAEFLAHLGRGGDRLLAGNDAE